MKNNNYSASIVKSFQALSMGVDQMIGVSETTSEALPAAVKPGRALRGEEARPARRFDAEPSALLELDQRFHKINRIGRANVRALLRE